MWLGPEMLDPTPGIESALALCSQTVYCQALFPLLEDALCGAIAGCPAKLPLVPNWTIGAKAGYADLLRFNLAGTPLNPTIAPSAADPDFRTLTLHPALAALLGFSRQPVYEDLIAFLTEMTAAGTGSTTIPADSMGRRLLDPRGLPNPRPLNSGPNGLYLFPYDWRGSMPTQAAALRTFINGVLTRPDVASVDTNPSAPGTQPIDRVVLVTHSLGGPVARLAYLQQPGLVDQVVSFGGAFGGVGLTVKILGMGDNWGIGLNAPVLDDLADAGWGLTVQPWKVQQLARNWPTAFDQTINSATWFSDHGTTAGGRIVNRSVQVGPFGAAVTTRAELDRLLDGFNSLLAAAARTFWDAPAQPGGVALEDFTGGTGRVFHYRVVGEGVSTDIGYHHPWEPTLSCPGALATASPRYILMECTPRPMPRAITADGDNIVPYKSAIGRTDLRDDRVFVIAATGSGTIPSPIGSLAGPPPPAACAQVVAAVTGDAASACQLRHGDLTSYGISLSLLNDILGGRVQSLGQAIATGLPFSSQTVPENQTLSNLSEPVPPPKPTPAPAPAEAIPTSVETGTGPGDPAESVPSPMELEVRGLVRVTVRDDSGNVLGAKPEDPARLVADDIPGARYRPASFLGVIGVGDADVTVPPTGGFDVVLTALDRTQLDVVGRGGRGGFSTGPIDLDAGATVTFHADPFAESPPQVTIIQASGAEDIVAVAALDRYQAADRTPPHSTGRVDGGRLVLDATDDSAGVRDTWLLLADRGMLRYTEPIDIPADQPVTVFAVDRAGNVEPPHGVDGAPTPDLPAIADS